ncbi:cytochrome P450 6a2-like isoform X2 [Osmia bicornis bicornis]|uniref:cytochrome P450 6a2-like isoform X2 n=1 Tax=Osmia bicornis bicornis TaxID=1437191 RepID=UPI001EAEAA86|nr:cytochrome P450 6a2-like isoform X2 [Osmia bicornis bicornis]
MWSVLEIVGFLVAILILLYYYSTSILEYWKERGVKGPKPIPFLGNFKDVYLGRISMNDCFVKAYREFKGEPMVGVFSGHIPHLVLRDPDLIKDVLIKDFSNFVERMVVPNEVEPLADELFSIEAKRWKPLRARISPVFTSGKLKEMFNLLVECGNQFEEYLKKLVEKDAYIECRDISAKFTIDVIGSCAFGIEANALAAEDSEFRKMELSDAFLAAQAFVFFTAGFETSSLTITHALYELAFNQSIQDTLRAETKDVLKRNNGEITYDSISELKYLDAVFKETLRKYPVVLWLSRTAMTPYTFPGTKVTIPKGQHVVVPVDAIHNDPDIFPEPEVFDPNRFLDNNAKGRHPMFYIPFGDGPRNCIGARFAKIQTKVAMIKILSNFKVDACEKTPKYNRDPKSLMLLQPEHGIYLKMTKI